MSGWLRIDIAGAVQGVGFRPTAWREAASLGLEGTVANAVDGVHIFVRGREEDAGRLVDAIRRALPPFARIDSARISPAAAPPDGYPGNGFIILDSKTDGDAPTDLTPDIAICPDCLADIAAEGRRHNFPLTNCTNCGPRFSIVEALPYDRPKTSMAVFGMCGDCRREYTDFRDRRFHAQPVCCSRCGPRYEGFAPDGSPLPDAGLPAEIARRLRRGEIAMLKGLGGYNLLADASNATAVSRLRQIKRRPRKPFAVMVANTAAARRLGLGLNADAEALLRSWRAPIVLLPRRAAGDSLAPETAPSCANIGVMLPYMGFHHLLFAAGAPEAVVVTSANLPGSPILTDDRQARDYAREISVACVGYNRRIVNRLDDSVVRSSGDGHPPLLLRRSRGYVPEPIDSQTPAADGIVATGADITSAWALGRGRDIILSPYVGSLTSPGSEEALAESVNSLMSLFRARPRMVAVDAHPGYLSSALGRRLAAKAGGIPIVEVWHHHAHAVSVMADLGIDRPVLALILDGTGYGPDGRIHGAELLRATRRDFETLASGDFLPLPGGDRASLDPWRMAVAAVTAYCGATAPLPPAVIRQAGGEANVAVLRRMIERGINTPQGCGAGRLWDAVASLLDLAGVNSYEAEAPILLEGLASRTAAAAADPYPLEPEYPLHFGPMFCAILGDIAAGENRSLIAARFHETFARAWSAVVISHSRRTGLKEVVASGGVFQNLLLVRAFRRLLGAEGISLLLPKNLPTNDGSIAAGQIAVAAARLNPENDA
ncbi:MAG: carbamoyltransferase HypF [Clostridium sp.]|nr:carbamoyltransferase HypF [Clostridium sp.]